MSKLSRLEKSELAELYKVLAPVKKSYTDNSDNIDDFIFNQFGVSCDDEEDMAALKIAREHFKIESKAMIEAFEIIDRLVEHFDC